MKLNEINIRDPFVVYENGTYYLYGTRAKDFGCHVGGVDVYRSKDLESWSEPIECFNSEQFGLNRKVNWAPEVHRYKGAYYMFFGKMMKSVSALCRHKQVLQIQRLQRCWIVWKVLT